MRITLSALLFVFVLSTDTNAQIYELTYTVTQKIAPGDPQRSEFLKPSLQSSDKNYVNYVEIIRQSGFAYLKSLINFLVLVLFFQVLDCR